MKYAYGRMHDSLGNRMLVCGHVADEQMYCRVAGCSQSQPSLASARALLVAQDWRQSGAITFFGNPTPRPFKAFAAPEVPAEGQNFSNKLPERTPEEARELTLDALRKARDKILVNLRTDEWYGVMVPDAQEPALIAEPCNCTSCRGVER